jgi:hypothetical protein
VVGRLPPVDDVGNLDLTRTEPKASWRLLGAIARIAFHFNQPSCGRVMGTCFVHFAVPSIVVPTRMEIERIGRVGTWAPRCEIGGRG